MVVTYRASHGANCASYGEVVVPPRAGGLGAADQAPLLPRAVVGGGVAASPGPGGSLQGVQRRGGGAAAWEARERSIDPWKHIFV